MESSKSIFRQNQSHKNYHIITVLIPFQLPIKKLSFVLFDMFGFRDIIKTA